jgi:predicted RNA-binding Zn-ribbon protein involved in translation (DUF1610 family)
MSGDLISRARLTNKIGDWFNNINYHPETGPDPFTIAMLETENEMIAAVIQEIKEAPAVDAEPVRHSRWKNFKKQNRAVCMACSFERNLDENFGRAVSCPNCGAKMRCNDETE